MDDRRIQDELKNRSGRSGKKEKSMTFTRIEVRSSSPGARHFIDRETPLNATGPEWKMSDPVQYFMHSNRGHGFELQTALSVFSSEKFLPCDRE
jgi:hypothetical protein